MNRRRRLAVRYYEETFLGKLYVALHSYAEAHEQLEQTKTNDLQMIMVNNVTNGVKIFENAIDFNDTELLKSYSGMLHSL
ncbi:unnamed protein product [Schistosoma intercalatum]|nr:unnamed protein product [Schistosoma intercalatum]